MIMVPFAGPRSASWALITNSLYQEEKSSLCGVTPRSSRAITEGYRPGASALGRPGPGPARALTDPGQLRLAGLVGRLVPQPLGDHRVALPRGDEGVAGVRARVPDDVPQPLGVNHELHPRMERDAGLGRRVLLVLAEDEHRLVSSVFQFQ